MYKYMNSNRHQASGKYAKKRGGKFKIFLFLVVIGLGFYGYSHFSKPTTYTKPTGEVAVKVDPNQSAIDKIKERENFKKRIENQAKQVYLQEQIADRQTKIEALQAEQKTLEGELEVTRQEELGL